MYGEPTFLTIESRTYNAGSLRAGGAWARLAELKIEIKQAYPSDVVLDDSRDGFCVLNIFFGDHGQVADLISVVVDEILERSFVVFCDFI